jgi:hypothetical protein
MRSALTKAIQDQFVKAARLPSDPVTVNARNEMISDGIGDVGRVLLLAGAAGIGLRGLQGAGHMFGRGKPALLADHSPALLEVPHPVFERPEDAGIRKRKRQEAIRGAMGTSVKAAEDVPKLHPVGSLLGMYKDPFNPDAGGGGWLSGHGASPSSDLGKTQMPWYVPAVGAGVVGGSIGGYKLMDWIMNKKRKADLKGELDDAKREYQEALVDMYDPQRIKLLKRGSAAEALARDLHELATLMTKAGGGPSNPSETWTDAAARQLDGLIPTTNARQVASSGAGAGLGLYAALAGGLALGSGYLAHEYFSKTDPNKVLADVIKKRERERWATRPPEIFAVPTPVSVRGREVDIKG